MTSSTPTPFRLRPLKPLIAAALCLATVLALGQSNSPSAKQLDARGVYALVRDTVVVVEATTAAGSLLQGSGVVFNHDLGPERRPTSSWIATNAHLVRNADRVIVRQRSQQTTADIVYIDDEYDLAILYADAVVFPRAAIEPKSKRTIGESVFAIGAPLGLEQTITQGIISSIRIQNNVTLIQFSASISNGNSGGGLFDAQARLIGITTFKLKGGENLNFAFDAKHVNDLDSVLFVTDFLRRVAKSNYADIKKLFTTDDIALINSWDFTKWLLHTSRPDGSTYWQSALSIHSEFKEQKSPPIERIERYFNDLTNILIQFVASRKSTRSSAATSPAPSIITLVCTQIDERGVRRGDLTIHLDIDNSMVTGIPAVISDSEVRFPFGKSFVAILNRYNGSIRMSTEGAPDFITGTCTRVTPVQRKF